MTDAQAPYAVVGVCGCRACTYLRRGSLRTLPLHQRLPTVLQPGWREACELCNRPDCPHHVSHFATCDGRPYKPKPAARR